MVKLSKKKTLCRQIRQVLRTKIIFGEEKTEEFCDLMDLYYGIQSSRYLTPRKVPKVNCHEDDSDDDFDYDDADGLQLNYSASTDSAAPSENRLAAAAKNTVGVCNSLKQFTTNFVANRTPAELAEAVKSKTGVKRDFTYVYAEGKLKEIDLERSKFEYKKEQDKTVDDLELKKLKVEMVKIKSDFAKKLMDEHKSAEEIKEMLAIVFGADY
jgi:hypothetical protein